MKKENIDQILKNQQAIMNVLFSQFYGNKKCKFTLKFLMEQIDTTARIINNGENKQ